MLTSVCFSSESIVAGKWTVEQTDRWYASQSWPVGCNFIPSTAINQLEMWQADTFDIETIDRELGWAHELGFNFVRVFLHNMLWEQDGQGLISRVNEYLKVADKHNIKTMFVLFDAVWDPNPQPGVQREPRPHVHNSGWVQSPSRQILADTAKHIELKGYVQGIISYYKNDNRVLLWDLYNEPGNRNTGKYEDYVKTVDELQDVSLKLCRSVFEWAREAAPSQPSSICVWNGDWSEGKVSPLNNFNLENSDIITYHNYGSFKDLDEKTSKLVRYGRPLICTEYMARPAGSTFYSALPYFRKYKIGACNWGFVAGKTQTQYPWDSWQKEYTGEPEVWFHDIFRPNGKPYDENETEFIKMMTRECVCVNKTVFGATPCGQDVSLYTMTNTNGVKVSVMDFGAAVTSVVIPDRNGKFADVALGYDEFNGYLCQNPYFGGIVGRFGNRISNGRFTLDGEEYVLNTNNNGQHLHGGIKGFDRVVWDSRPFTSKQGSGVVFHYLSVDGEENYPGNLDVTVTYTLTNDNELKIDYKASTDKATPINLTQHGYWNLAGQGNGDVLGHIMMISADKFTPVDKTLIPTGELRNVKGTPLDFTSPIPIGKSINEPYQQIVFGKGYDHNWVLGKEDNLLSMACCVYEPISGRELTIYTTEPAMQFYSGNFLDGTITGKQGKVYNYRTAIVFEPQHFPDSPNHPEFPNTILRPGKTYNSTTIYKFGIH